MTEAGQGGDESSVNTEAGAITDQECSHIFSLRASSPLCFLLFITIQHFTIYDDDEV